MTENDNMDEHKLPSLSLYINIARGAHDELSGEVGQLHASSSLAPQSLELEARACAFDRACCRLEAVVEPYGGGSKVTSPASKSLNASSRSNRALKSACRRPGVGILNRGTPSLSCNPRPFREEVVLGGGMAKIAGSRNVRPSMSSLSLLYVLRVRPPRPMSVREGLDDRGAPTAEDEDRSAGTRARAQAPARLKTEEKLVALFDAPVSIEKGTRGILPHDGWLGLDGEV
jgi:hypothetical protein